MLIDNSSPFTLSQCSTKLPKPSDQDELLLRLQYDLLHLQQALFHEQKRAVLVFEGIDAAGKGGTIKRLVEHMDPRGYVVHPIGAPGPAELGQHYLQRFWTRLPTKGSITIFDRSWYGRVLVERVEKLTARAAWQRAYEEIKQFEKMLTDDGIILIKIFMHISKREQGERFRARLEKPSKRWKITMADFETRKHWSAYQRAFSDMLSKTAVPSAPWLVVPADSKRAARPYALAHCKSVFRQSLQHQRVRFITPEIRAAAKSMFDLELD